MKRWQCLSIVPFLVVALACSSDGTPFVGGPIGSTRGVTQGGAQDIEVYRRIVESGEVPATDTLDPVGFFAEHAIDLPPATCGETICVFPSLAVAPRFDNSNWTMAYVALGSSLDPATLPRDPAHVIFVVGADLPQATSGLERALTTAFGALAGEDRYSVIVAGERPTLVRENVAQLSAIHLLGEDDLRQALAAQRAVRSDLYAALSLAGELASAGARRPRIVLLTSGDESLTGIRSADRIGGLGASLAAQGVGISVIGVGNSFDGGVVSALGELGTGTVASARNGDDLRDILVADAETAFTPIATDLELVVTPSPAYRVGRIFGGRQLFRTQDGATWRAPALFLGHRESATDVSRGRRGGGSGFFVELLLRDDAAPGALAAGAAAFSIATRFETPDGSIVRQEQSVINPLAPGENPDAMWPEFVGLDKPFMMLNMFLALRATTELYEAGQCSESLGVQPMMRPVYEEWQTRYDDPDIDADDQLLGELTANIGQRCQASGANTNPSQPTQMALGCFGI